MDTSKGMTAADYVNTVSEKDFCQALRDYGDEKWAARIAQILIEKRKQAPLRTTQDLVKVVDAAIPKAVRRKDDGHPARRTFQAVRIVVNDELAPLEKAINDWVDLLLPGGRRGRVQLGCLDRARPCFAQKKTFPQKERSLCFAFAPVRVRGTP